ncbi:multicopper oxidase domain-containing protein [Brevibacillus agri]|uniref:multicopper oxidase domain-containing protein n=1 Tax=Brevibacillus TaxID=55080 RepID=UPI002E1EC316|nr:multicopper oxidase domain-containing protein [Brevibacillus agri]MED1646135.1 multicopper oxidase domain-containing protein [Brevibacillus agri]MED1657502.1 multicopper oxidase domain-containing protein [Brevibacillus agri]MED1690110.1 multicopper oxidase domain-containing protein [Brevibacillus agri]MED1694426.1 multicopper oxidase domain-containing protein [Brevibacillus agri]MED1700288.1 multicopper oxidase domain-containing protein [Brevibacillus agri]
METSLENKPEQIGNSVYPEQVPELTSTKLRDLPVLCHTDQIRLTGEVREYHLQAIPVQWELVKGVQVEVWSFNGHIPGPTIRVKEGDLVRITLENRLPAVTSIHWHGLHVPNQVDGVGMLTEPGVAPGETKTYEFVANHAGTFLYHSHVDEIQQVDLGLYGAFIIDPQAPSTLEHDRDCTLVMSGWVVSENASSGRTDHHIGHSATVLEVQSRDINIITIIGL